MIPRGEEIGRTASGPTFSRVPIVTHPGVIVRFGETVLIDREDSWGYIGRIIGGLEQNAQASPSTLQQVIASLPNQTYASAFQSPEGALREVQLEILEEIHKEGDRFIFKPPRTIPPTDARVFRVGPELVSLTFGFHKENPIVLGKEELTESEVRLPVEALVRHITILGRPGTGKSYTRGVLMEECARHGVPVVSIDITGESEQSVKELGGVTLRPGQSGFTVRLSHFTSAELTEIIPNMPAEEAELVIDSFQHLYQSLGARLTLHDLLNEISKAGDGLGMAAVAARARKHVNYSIRNKEFIGIGMDWVKLFRNYPIINIYVGDMIRKYAIFMVAAICRELMHMREKKECPPFLFILDEAHRFIPKEGREISADVIANFLRVGRHLSVGTVIVSQSPSGIERELLILSNTRIIHALDGTDLDAVSGLLGDAPEQLKNRIPILPVGTALLSGSQELVRHTCTVSVRTRETTHGAPTPDLIKEATEWRKKSQERNFD